MKRLMFILKSISAGFGVLLLLVVWYGIWLFVHTVFLQQAESWVYPFAFEWGGTALIVITCGAVMYKQFLSTQHLSAIPLLICFCFTGLYFSTIWLPNWWITIILALFLFGLFCCLRSCYPYVKHIHIMWMLCHLMSMSLCGTFIALYVKNSSLVSLDLGCFLGLLSLATFIKWLYMEYKGF